MGKLHPKQQQLLILLRDNIDNPLTIRELGSCLHEDTPSVVYHHLQQLEKKGYVKRNPDNPRDYTVLGSPEKAVVYINKYGMAQCGPNGSILEDNPVARIPIASSLLRYPASEVFIVEARGDSMEPKIYEGDIIIARKQNYAEHDDIVVCVYKGDALIKKYSTLHGAVSLVSLNTAKHHPFQVTEDLRIEGVVKNILHYH